MVSNKVTQSYKLYIKYRASVKIHYLSSENVTRLWIIFISCIFESWKYQINFESFLSNFMKDNAVDFLISY